MIESRLTRVKRDKRELNVETRKLVEFCANKAMDKRRWRSLFYSMLIPYAWVGFAYALRGVIHSYLLWGSLPITALISLWVFFKMNNSYEALYALTMRELDRMGIFELREHDIKEHLMTKQRSHLGFEEPEKR